MTKEEKNQYQKEYRKRNKEKIKQQNKEYNKIYREKNKEKINEYNKQYYENNEERKQYMKEYRKYYYENNKEKIYEYRQTPQGKKVNTISDWKRNGLLETKEKIEELYKIYTTIKFCEACDIELTRTGKSSATDINLDHCHTTGRFRLMLCGNCNRQDNWKKHFC